MFVFRFHRQLAFHCLTAVLQASVLLTLLAAGAPLRADEQLARANACIACHQVERKVVGPAFREVARRRAGEADAEDVLVDHIRHGSKGVYGPVPMPPNTRVSEADARALARWILGLQPPSQ